MLVTSTMAPPQLGQLLDAALLASPSNARGAGTKLICSSICCLAIALLRATAAATSSRLTPAPILTTFRSGRRRSAALMHFGMSMLRFGVDRLGGRLGFQAKQRIAPEQIGTLELHLGGDASAAPVVYALHATLAERQ
jgi:hypothetical protein